MSEDEELPDELKRCSFCMADQDDPKLKCFLIGVSGSICDGCIEICATALGEHLAPGFGLTATDLHQLKRIQNDKTIALSVLLRNRQLIDENNRLRKENNDLQAQKNG